MKLIARLIVYAVALHCAPAFAFGPEGHMAVGAIADELLKGTNAAKESRKIVGSTLRTASVWADCAKGVDERTFKYGGAGKYPECAVYERSTASKKLMEGFVKRNVGTCEADLGDESCHRQYHYSDVGSQRDGYEPSFKGTSDHDVVAAINAMIAVLQDKLPPHFTLLTRKRLCDCWLTM
jgi:S1/P1 Nuclease